MLGAMPLVEVTQLSLGLLHHYRATHVFGKFLNQAAAPEVATASVQRCSRSPALRSLWPGLRQHPTWHAPAQFRSVIELALR
jgi:hypothetical protein